MTGCVAGAVAGSVAGEGGCAAGVASGEDTVVETGSVLDLSQPNETTAPAIIAAMACLKIRGFARMAAPGNRENRMTFLCLRSYHISMPHASISPAEISLVCEKCGYVLNGLDFEGRCPECGTPIGESSPELRQPPPWEQLNRSAPRGFIRTTHLVIFHPSRFFRALPTRDKINPAWNFCLIQYSIASVLFGWAIAAHLSSQGLRRGGTAPTVAAFAVLVTGSMIMLTGLAARLTTWEATYRGYRLPLPVVQRGLYYHAAHYIPVAMLVCVTTVSYAFLRSRGWISESRDTVYLYVLCGEVVLAAGYLFNTYWIAMRKMMFANR